MQKDIKKEFIEICKSEKEEVCGFFVSSNENIKIIKCGNQSNKRINEFIISPKEYIEISKSNKILGIFHSHIDCSSNFSNQDIKTSEELNFTFFVYSCLDDNINIYKPKEVEKNKELKRLIKYLKN